MDIEGLMLVVVLISPILGAIIILARQIKGLIGRAKPYVWLNGISSGFAVAIGLFYLFDAHGIGAFSSGLFFPGVPTVLIAGLLGAAQYKLGKVPINSTKPILVRIAAAFGVILLAVAVSAITLFCCVGLALWAQA